MKVEILKENLKRGLNIVGGVVGKNLSLPILDNVLITTKDSFLSFISTNLETTIRLWVLTKIIEGGKTLVPLKFLSSFAASPLGEKIIMEARDGGLYVECENLKTQIRGYNPEEYPIIPEFKLGEHVEVDNQAFCRGLAQVIDIASPSSGRPEISGIYFSFLNKNLKVVATDSFRLAEKNIVLQKPTTKEYSFILPQKPAREIITILENKEGVIKIYFSNNQALFEFPIKELPHPEVQIISRLIEGEYPNYQDIIPNKFKTHIILKKDEFLNQVKTASLFASKTNEVKISIYPQKNSVEIFAKNPNIGESKSTMSAKTEGEPMEISFNYKYLIDGLLNIKSSEILFEVSKEEGPCILRPIGDNSYLYVLMPIKSI